MTTNELNALSHRIIGCAMRVHAELGPGLLESAYEACLVYELQCEGLAVQRQLYLPLRYKGIEIDCGYRIDLIVEDAIIVELKTVSAILPVHSAQLLTYLRLTNRQLGLLINFNVALLREGVRRLVHNLPDA
jgi:GxxExxY protein